VLVGLAAAALYPLLPSTTSQNILYSIIGTASVVCILLGIRFLQPNDRTSWYLFAAGGLCFTLGDDAWSYYSLIFHSTLPSPSLADLLYLAGYPFLFVGVMKLTPKPSSLYRREVVIDSFIVTIGAASILWYFLMASYLSDDTASTLAKVVNMAYPVMDLALVFIVCSRLLFSKARQPFHLLLTLSLVVMFVADFIYDLQVLHNSLGGVTYVDALYLVQYVLIAAAAVHPSVSFSSAVAEEGGLARDSERALRGGRLPLILLAGFIPPTMLVIAAAGGLKTGDLMLAVFCMAMFGAAFVRMGSLVERITNQARKMEINEDRLRYLANHDALTGLANRSLLRERLEEALASQASSGDLVALCLGDLDGFKNINDTLGHAAGDMVLVNVGALLTTFVRSGDTVARLGGDEFAVLMVGAKGRDDVVRFANRIVSSMDQALEEGGSHEGASMSVGVAFGSSESTVEQLVSEADAAMYEAKAAGRACVRVFEPEMRTRLFERFELVNGFAQALERSEFLLDFQPIYALKEMRLTGFEALIRWRHPMKGMMLPLNFIPLAEETGFILPLGRWVLDEACNQLASWSDANHAPLSLSVNVSRRQLTSHQLIDDISSVLSITGVAPEQLVIEVTESMLMHDPDMAQTALEDLHASGIRIALDDFGTGYSSLSQLQRFPVDIIKIDKSFVDPLGTEPAGVAIVSSILGLAQSMGLSVVAEGIERTDQLERLLELGCDLGQGYLLGKPLGAASATALIGEKRGARLPT
jgi:diguanylate cyclase (GGDEF)-like protein